jgi:hypothetical protein
MKQWTMRVFAAGAVLAALAQGAAAGLFGMGKAAPAEPVAVGSGGAVPPAKAFRSMESAPAAKSGENGQTLLRLPFGKNAKADRFYWDLPVRFAEGNVPAVELAVSSVNPWAVRAVTLHADLGDGKWHSAQQTLSGGKERLLFQAGDFVPPLTAERLGRAKRLRFSFWRSGGGGTRQAEIWVEAIRVARCRVAILEEKGTEAHALSARQLFAAAGIPAVVLPEGAWRGKNEKDFGAYDWVVLPCQPKVGDDLRGRLERFLKRSGARLAVFYCADAALGRLMECKPRGYRAQDKEWLAVGFAGEGGKGMPAAMAHRTRNLMPVEAVAEDARHRTSGHWLGADGRPLADLPAAAVSPKGFWFSHVPPLATPAAVQFLLGAMAESDPQGYAGLRDGFAARLAKERRDAAAILAECRPAPGEIRAAWLGHVPAELEFRDAEMAALARAGVNTLFVGAGQPGDPLPQAGTKERLVLERTVRAAAAYGIAVHTWITTLRVASREKDGLPGGRLQGTDGKPRAWRCPLARETVAGVQQLAVALAGCGVAGVHLDYVRYPDETACYCPTHRELFQKTRGKQVARWPADVAPGGKLEAEYQAFSAAAVTRLVRGTRAAMDAAGHRGTVLSAAVLPVPESALARGQAWADWLGDVAFVAPMSYTPLPEVFRGWLGENLAYAGKKRAGKVLPGLGLLADRVQLSPKALAEQIRAVRETDAAGFAVFQAVPCVELPPLR